MQSINMGRLLSLAPYATRECAVLALGRRRVRLRQVAPIRHHAELRLLGPVGFGLKAASFGNGNQFLDLPAAWAKALQEFSAIIVIACHRLKAQTSSMIYGGHASMCISLHRRRQL